MVYCNDCRIFSSTNVTVFHINIRTTLYILQFCITNYNTVKLVIFQPIKLIKLI